MILTPEQVDAVTRSGQDVCVVAGPGSGKTRVLIERFRWHVEHGASPLRLLAVTFTEKAANELKQRLASSFSGSLALRDEVERAHVSTIDSFCAGLLRSHAIEAGLDPAFTVLDAADAGAELWEAAEQALDDFVSEDPPAARSLLAALDLSDAVAALVRVRHAIHATATSARAGASERFKAGSNASTDLLDAARDIAGADSSGGTPKQRAELEAVRQWARRLIGLAGQPVSLEHFRILGAFNCNLARLRKNSPVYDQIKAVKTVLLEAARQELIGEYYKPQRAALWRLVQTVDDNYRRRKESINALDFADLEEHAIRLLRDNAQLRSRIRAGFDEILMDELQDTNPLQASLVELIRHPEGFFGVGDVNQSIYGFRHASPETFRSYRRALEVAQKPVDRLYRNFRSRAGILYATETVLENANGIESQRLEAARPFPPAVAPAVEVIAATGEDMERAAEIEAECVAHRIAEFECSLEIDDRAGGLRPARLGDMAILLRNVNALPPFERALERRGIPYIAGRGKRFYEAPEIASLVHLLRVIVNPLDEVSMAAVLRSPLVGVGNETLFRLKEGGGLGTSLAELERLELREFAPADLERLRSFRSLLREARAMADEVSPDRLLARFMDASAFEATLGARARANVAKLLSRIRQWHAGRPRPLIKLVFDLERLRASDPDEPAAPPDEASNAVRLLTIHAAKGLEFPVVFLAAMHKGVSNETPALAFSPSAGLVARWLDPVSGEPVRDLAYTVYNEDLRREQANEENRLLYVAMTRAEERLVLSFAFVNKPKNWAARVAGALRLDLEKLPPAPALYTAPVSDPERAFEYRFWLAASAPEAAAGVRRQRGEAGIALQRYAGPVTAQHDSTVDVTSVTLFKICPRRYFLGRYLGFKEHQQPPHGRGHITGGEMPDAGEFGREVHDLLAEIRLPHPSRQALELAAAFKSSGLGRRAAAAARCEREFPFMMTVGDVIVQGRIDLWFEEGGELVVVDYKTGRVEKDEIRERAAEYAVQMRLYALAVERYAGRLPNRACLYFLRPGITAQVSLEQDALHAALDAVRSLAAAQNTMEFPLCEGAHCFRCGFYKGLCPAAL